MSETTPLSNKGRFSGVLTGHTYGDSLINIVSLYTVNTSNFKITLCCIVTTLNEDVLWIVKLGIKDLQNMSEFVKCQFSI